MAKSKIKTIYSCQNCGAQRSRWEGRCSDCGTWNSLVEETFKDPDQSPRALTTEGGKFEAVGIANAVENDFERLETGVGELNRVLGGGLTYGSFTLIGGEPGIGKSTLLLQMAGGLASKSNAVLYVSAEESVGQTGQRARRMGINESKISLAAENNLVTIIENAKIKKPAVLIVDSIQTVFHPDIQSAPGSVSQVRECAGHLMNLAKSSGISIVVVGHVTKDGNIAGPKVLEHLVDTVLSFEGDHNHQFRLLRAVKNRFGATSEVGVFQMGSGGLREVTNPSELFLQERSEGALGSVVFPSLEGSRPVLCEVQALTVSSPLPMPRRTTVGFDINRLHLLIAVLERHGGVSLINKDIFANVVGGLKLDEPAADLAVAAAIISSVYDLPVPMKSVFFGEIGLTGEIRAVPMIELRVREADKLGFERFYAPYSNKRNLFDLAPALEKKIIWLKNIRDLKMGSSNHRPSRDNRPSRPEISAD